jgi:predicted dehydrogenase
VIGPSHLKLAAATDLAKVVAVADRIADRVESVGDAFGIARRYRSDEDLLRDPEVEAVILAMPVGDRTPAAFRALQAGKHVLLEKPVAGTAADVERMMALRGDRVVACCSPRMAFAARTQAAAACVASGVLGEIRIIRFRAIGAAPDVPNPSPPPWRESMAQNGGGILVNWSCYDLDYVLNIVGWRVTPKSVLARWWPVGRKMTAYVAPGSDADAHFIALVVCEGGTVLSMERAEFASAASDQAWEIIGSDATLHAPMLRQATQPDAVVLDRFVPGKGVVAETIWQDGQGQPDGDVVVDFVRAIRSGGSPRTPLERALVMQKITDAVYASSATGVSVAL